MSAFAVIYERSNIMVDPSELERMMGRLSHRGPDGSDVLMVGHIALGHWHFWTTPEEVGEKQPLELPGMPVKIVLDGRLDNRSELMYELGIPTSESSRLSDASLILLSYNRWEEHCFEHFIGPFALVILDEQRGEILCARDALGDRTLFYTFHGGTRLAIASEPWAVAGAVRLAPELNESAAAHYFALKATADGQTLFKDVYELLPAHVMRVNASSQHTWRYWKPDLSRRVRGRSDEEYAEEFRGLLEQSVRCRLRSASPAGVLMSGGMDSTSVACLAARLLAPQPLTTISYVFDELSDCDEREYIEAVKSTWGIHSIQLPSDDLWPLKNWLNWPRNPNHPEGNLYRLIKEQAYQRTQQEGLRVLLTGAFGDHLYSGVERWLADFLVEGRLFDAAHETAFFIRYAGLSRFLEAGFLQSAVKSAIHLIPGGKRPLRKQATQSWLTSLAANYLHDLGDDSNSAGGQRANLVGSRAAQSCSGEIFNASRYSLELRHPYRDRRLVEFVLTLPAYQFYHQGFYKYILRNAMQDLLPEIIRTRRQPTSLVSMFLRGFEFEKGVLQSCFQNPQAAWRQFVDENWISRHWNELLKKKGIESLLPWLCISFEAWHAHFISHPGIISSDYGD